MGSSVFSKAQHEGKSSCLTPEKVRSQSLGSRGCLKSLDISEAAQGTLVPDPNLGSFNNPYVSVGLGSAALSNALFLMVEVESCDRRQSAGEITS